MPNTPTSHSEKGDFIRMRIDTAVVWIADQPGGQQKFGLRVLAMH